MDRDIENIIKFIKEEEFLLESVEDENDHAARLKHLNKLKEKYGLLTRKEKLNYPSLVSHKACECGCLTWYFIGEDKLCFKCDKKTDRNFSARS